MTPTGSGPSPQQGWSDPNDEPEFHLPEHHSPLPELVHTEAPHPVSDTAAFVAMSLTPEYAKLRSTFRNFAFPMTIAGLSSYFVYVLLSIYATDFMATPLIGALNIGTVMGLFQFVVVYTWTALYVRFANKRLDHASAAIKSRLEKGVQA